MNVIEATNLKKSYGANRGIECIDLTVSEGEIYGFIGPNGAGKSTFIKTLLNFVFPTSGSARIFDCDVVTDSAAIKQQVGYVPSEVNLYPGMTVKELISYTAAFYPNTDKSYTQLLCERFEVQMDKKIGELSLGNKKKVALVSAMMHQPRLLILDEPTNGLDPIMQKRLFDLIEETSAQGNTVFFSSHNLAEVEQVCHKVAIIKEGKIVEVKRIDKQERANCKEVTVVWKETPPDLSTVRGVRQLQVNGDETVFQFTGDVNALIALLSAHAISNVTIEQPHLSQAFMQYYGGDRS